MNPSAPLEVPLDVRLMNALSYLLLAVAAALFVGAAFGWLARLPMFAIKGVTVTGDVAHYNAITLQANVVPRLQGTFFTLDVNAARKVFETMPWVRRAVVQREFPNRLKVRLQEHEALAYWGVEGDARLVNRHGEVFEANVGELDRENLPRLNGPQGQSVAVLGMLHTLEPLFEPLDMGIDVVELSPLGSWHIELDSGTDMELGGGSTTEVVQRLQTFLRTVTQVTARYQRKPEQLASVDLRHRDGYAIRLTGVETMVSDKLKKQ